MISRYLIFIVLLSSTTLVRAQVPASKKARIMAVENSLLPYVPVKDFKGWNLPDRMKFYRVPGVSIAVIHNFKIDWVKGYGWADTLKNIPVSPETMFSAGSISKLVTAVAALKIVENNQLNLDLPINNYLTSWHLPDNEFTQRTPVTLRLLLSHQAGVSQSSYYGFTPDKTTLPSVLDILNGLPAAESRPIVVNSEPKKEFRYSGGAYMVAQQAIMDVTKKEFALLIHESIFKVLGMAHTTFAQPLPPVFSQRASWAYSENSWFKGMPYVYPQQAAAGLYATPQDLARFIIALQQSYRGKSNFLKPATVQNLITPQVLVSNGVYREEMGLGAFLMQRSNNQQPDGVYFEHTGVNAGFLAYAIGNLAAGNGVVIMLNKDGAADELGKEIRRAVAKVYTWTNFLPESIIPKPLPDSLLDQYTGRYQRGPDEVVTFRKENNYLLETINQSRPIYCFPVAKDTVAFSDYPFRGVFRRNPQRQIIGLEILELGKLMPRLADTSYLPNELLRKGRLNDAVAAYRKLQWSEYHLTYMAYELMHERPAKLKEAESILQLANQQFPQSGIVEARFGDLYSLQGKKAEAIQAYQRALVTNPEDKDLKNKLIALTAP